ncbi:hypothetical protein Scep_030237 [Stephania cephalantha]|uniref:FLZ-type domain-containing protein n=1 Tax=Stephania cephalantha TaxID=152367 RepID=A0AAP0DZE4_9MAGN
MSVKRSRIGRSSSLGDRGLVDLLSPIEPLRPRWRKRAAETRLPANANTTKAARSAAKPSNQKPLQPVVFTLGSPASETLTSEADCFVDSVNERTGAFFEACFLCKRRIGDQDDVFMYSYLRAFCSPECRDEQIARDERQKKACSRS